MFVPTYYYYWVCFAGRGMTMIVVTHEIGFARDVADRIAILDKGVVIEEGPAAQVIDSPSHERSRSFLSRVTAGPRAAS